jgi:hypothetical protein
MTRIARLRAACLAAPAALAALVLPTAAQADTINGRGEATITKDFATVRSLAQAEAQRDLVRAMLGRTIGRDRLGEVPPDVIESIARQIRPDMITGQASERQGNLFITTITAEIDQAWFRGLLSDAGIDSASQRADGDRALILVYLDRADGTATDLGMPAEVDTAYDRRTGASFSDHSVVTASAKEASAASSRSASAYSQSAAGAQRSRAAGAYTNRSAAAYGASDGYGSAAGHSRSSSSGGFAANSASAYSARSAGASASKSSSAYAASSSYADRTSVDAEVHDDVTFRQHVVYQQAPLSADGDAIKAGLTGALTDYGVETGDSWMAMSEYFRGGVPRYADLKQDQRYGGFLRSLATRNTPFFMGGTYRVTQSGIDPASNQSACSGELDATAAASADGRIIASGQFPATALGTSPENCSANLTSKMARAAAGELGPRIQNFWRNKARAAVGQDSRQMAGYSLVLRGPKLDMGMQADLMDALAQVPGVENPAFVSQSATELRVNVTYAGAQPLQFAIYQKLRAHPAFAAMQATADGRSIVLCLAACQ